MSSLAAQLDRIRLASIAGASSSGLSRVHGRVVRASFLWTGSEAANIDNVTVNNLGINGWSEICLIDPRFSDFEASLFNSDEWNTGSRSLMTKEENIALNSLLESFLRLLSPYFLLKAAHKVIEYLIRRYSVQQNNVEDLIAFGIPFHDHELFGRLCSVIGKEGCLSEMATVGQQRSRWYFLATYAENGAILPREALVKQCLNDLSVAKFIFDLVKFNAREQRDAKRLYSLFGAVAVGMLSHSSNLNEAVLRLLVPYTIDGIKSSNSDYRAASVIASVEMSRTGTNLPTAVFDALLLELSKAAVSTTCDPECLLAIIAMCHGQCPSVLPDKSFKFLVKYPSLGVTLSGFGDQYDLSIFLKLLLESLVDHVDRHENYARILCDILNECLSSRNFINNLIQNLVIQVVDHNMSAEGDDVAAFKLSDSYRKVFFTLSERYPMESDAGINKCLSNINSDQNVTRRKRRFHVATACIEAVFSGTTHTILRDSGTTLLLALEHSSPIVRLHALQKLKSLDGQSSESVPIYVREAILRRLTDSEPQVVKAVFSLAGFLSSLNPEEVFARLHYNLSLDLSCNNSNNNSPNNKTDTGVRNRISRILGYLVKHVIPNHPKFSLELMPLMLNSCIVYPFTQQVNLAVAKYLGGMNHPLTNHVSEKLRDVIAALFEDQLDLSTTVKETEVSAAVIGEKRKSNAAAGKSKKLRPLSLLSVAEMQVNEAIIDALAENVASSPKELSQYLLNSCSKTIQQAVLSIAVLLRFCEISDDFNVEVCWALCICLHALVALRQTQWNSVTHGTVESRVADANNSYITLLASCHGNDVASEVGFFKLVLRKLFGFIKTSIEDIIISANCPEVSMDNASCVETDTNISKGSSNIWISVTALILQIPNISLFRDELMVLASSIGHIVSFCRALILFITSSSSVLKFVKQDLTNSDVISILQNRALLIIKSIIVGQYQLVCASKSRQYLTFQPLLSSLLFGLTNQNRMIRDAALDCLYECRQLLLSADNDSYAKSLDVEYKRFGYDVPKDCFISFDLHLLVLERIYNSKTEIAEDFSYFNLVFVDFSSQLDYYISCIARAAIAENWSAVAGVLSLQSLSVSTNRFMFCHNIGRDIVVSNKYLASDQVVALRLVIKSCDFMSRESFTDDSLDNDSFSSFCTILSSSNVFCGGDVTVSSLALSLVTPNFFDSISVSRQQQLLVILVRLLVVRDLLSRSDLVICLKKLTLHGEHVAEIISSTLGGNEGHASNSNSTLKKRRAESSVAVPTLTDMSTIVAVLELLNLKSYRQVLDNLEEEVSQPISNVQCLVAPLFRVLSSFPFPDISASEQFDTFGNIEYIIQLTLSALDSIALFILNDNVATEDRKVAIANFDVALITRFLPNNRANEVQFSPQTTSYALAFLASMASLIPADVLKAVVSAISDVGMHALGQDNDYSHSVVKEVVSRIVPAAVAQGVEVKPILETFCSNIGVMAPHRRLPTFVALVEALSPSRLYVLWCMLLKVHVTSLASEPSTSDLRFDQFAVEVVEQFSPLIQVSAIYNLLAVVIDIISLLDDKNFSSDNLAFSCIFPSTENYRHNSQFLFTYCILLVKTANEHLSSKEFIRSSLSFEESEAIQAAYLSLTSTLLVLLRRSSVLCMSRVHHLQKIEKTEHPSHSTAVVREVKHSKALVKESYNILSSLDDLLSTATFVQITCSLVRDSDPQIRRKALLLFNDRLRRAGGVSASDAKLFVLLANDLKNLLEAPESDTSLMGKQSVLLSLDILVQNFCSMEPDVFLSCVPSVLSVMKASDSNVLGSALLCLATLCAQLGVKIVPYLNSFFPFLINTLLCQTGKNANASVSELVQLSVVAAMEASVSSFPQFLGPFIPDLISSLIDPDITGRMSVEGDSGEAVKATLAERSRSLILLIGSKVPVRLLAPHIPALYKKAVTLPPLSVQRLLSILTSLIPVMDKDSLQSQAPFIFKFLMIVFDYRRLYRSYSASTGAVETTVTTAFVALVMKLKEQTFKSVLLRAYDWAMTKPSDIEDHIKDAGDRIIVLDDSNEVDRSRAIVFFRLIHALASSLKTIFTPFFAYLLDSMLMHLSRWRGRSQNLVKTPKTKTKGVSKSVNVLEESEEEELVRLIIDCIRLLCMYDTQNFIDENRFESILSVIVDALGDINHSQSDVYVERIDTCIIPCLTHLSSAVHDDTLWKSLNHSILLKTRHSDFRVRLASLKALKALFVKMGDAYLPLIPEAIPFLAETMEDDNPDVEIFTRKLIKHVEDLSGESLQDCLLK